MTLPLILVTNDDGVMSPGLLALAEAIDPLGELVIVAPREQQSGAGRSMHSHYEGRMDKVTLSKGSRTWVAYAADASPALCVQYGVIEIAGRPVDLVASGINYGENVGTGVSISGTVGAALEGSAFGVPGLAVSLQVDPRLHLEHDNSVDFSVAGYFAHMFARKLLGMKMPYDVDVLKLDIPANADRDSEWEITCLEKNRYYIPIPPNRDDLRDAGIIGYQLAANGFSSEDSDAAALHRGHIAVTPLSLDMTSRIRLGDVYNWLSLNGSSPYTEP